MATLVTCGWAGAAMVKVTGASGQGQLAQNAQKSQKWGPTKQLTDQPSNQPINQPANQPTNQWTKQGVRD